LKNRIAIVALAALMLLISSCTLKAPGLKPLSEEKDIIGTKDMETDAENGTETEQPEENSTNFGASIGGIQLGDSPEDVAGLLGRGYAETIEEDAAGMIGEDMIVRTYENGITIWFGKDSGKVIRILSSTSDHQTDLGLKVGDTANKVFECYEKAFETPKSRHSGKSLTGWYSTGADEVIIFDFNKENDIRTNFDIEPDSLVEEIVLGFWKHFD
jgi:hypothetical protein